MKRISFLVIAATALFLSCSSSNGETEKARNDSTPGSTNAAPAAPVPTNHNARLQPIMDSTMIRMGRVELTNNPTKDFAMLMRMHHVGGRHLIQEALKNNTDSGISKLARTIDASLAKESVDLNRFIIDKRYQQKQKESKASNELMKAMTPANETASPTANSNEEEFPRVMITYLQTANDMVKVMEDNGADYDISGFAEEMVARNKGYIEQLKQLATK